MTGKPPLPVRFQGVGIRGIVASVPARAVANADMPDPDAAAAAGRFTGVLERRVCTPGQGARGLCTAAARALLARMAWAPESVDVLVYVTQTPEQSMPADAYLIAAELGLPRAAITVQASWACTAYVMGLYLAAKLCNGGRVLLLVGDATTRACDPLDRATGPLFGDAGSATAIDGTGDGTGAWVLGQDPSGADKLRRPADGPMVMNGIEVAAFALRTVPRVVEALQAHGPQWWAFHQANAHILAQIVKRTGLGPAAEAGRVPQNIARFGNCAGASIPLLMATDRPLRHALLNGDTRLALVGFGAGWAWAGAALDVERLVCCDMIEVEAEAPNVRANPAAAGGPA